MGALGVFWKWRGPWSHLLVWHLDGAFITMLLEPTGPVTDATNYLDAHDVWNGRVLVAPSFCVEYRRVFAGGVWIVPPKQSLQVQGGESWSDLVSLV